MTKFGNRKILMRSFSKTMHFDRCVIPRTTVCKHTQVYDYTLLRYTISTTWRQELLLTE